VPKVVITMPAYRAEGTLAQTIADIPAGLADELILVDDASADDTARVARGLGVRVYVHPTNRGYGGNQKTCYTTALKAGADIVVLLHPDYQYDPKAVPLLIAPILAGDADMTFGSRFAGLGDPLGGGMPLYRFVGNRITTQLENLMLGSRFTDMHSGMRAYNRRCLLTLPFLKYTDDFAFDSQVLVDAITLGQRVVEVPIPTRYTKESSSIAVGPSMRYIRESLLYSARRSATRGRRGRRSVIAKPRMAIPGPAPARPGTSHPCALCSSPTMLLHPANVEKVPRSEEFACTTETLGRHDDIFQCRSCGLVQSDPGVSPDELVKLYEQAIDESYLAEEGARRALFNWTLDRLEGYAIGGRRLLEIGASVGLMLDVAGHRGWEARGIEPAHWAVELGRKRFGVDLRQGTAESQGEPDRSADAIVLMDVLEHLVDPREALRKLRHVLDEEGILGISTINVTGLHSRLRGEHWPWFTRSHLFYFSPVRLIALLRETGYRPIQILTVPRTFHVSYLVGRGGLGREGLEGFASTVTESFNPKMPTRWLQDSMLVFARPS
jgi:SAM-dependent methyltransferase